MTPAQRNDLRARIKNAKLSSDDHGHDTTALREYCEKELIWAYDIAMPALLDQVEAYEEALNTVMKATSEDEDMLTINYIRKVLAKYQGHGG